MNSSVFEDKCNFIRKGERLVALDNLNLSDWTSIEGTSLPKTAKESDLNDLKSKFKKFKMQILNDN